MMLTLFSSSLARSFVGLLGCCVTSICCNMNCGMRWGWGRLVLAHLTDITRTP
ncbi:hypothetical protein BDN70DRAFT_872407 [Pholiota conissans]|uniref:Uncharacterized protein n=1 Tax=Pholiota conissans TaxID=109636 RepID=A0A9P5ZAT6_9AGAR|nr:hypothetical protein BDN70DRAFT_872407 [Pholiota conissans]